MKQDFHIKVSDTDICVLAGLLGYESVFGIADMDILHQEEAPHRRVRQTVRRLERKRLIRYDLDGTLYIVPFVRRMVSCLCSAETVGVVSTNLDGGKRTAVYALGGAEGVTLLEGDGDRKYSLRWLPCLTVEQLIPKAMQEAGTGQLSEQLSMTQAKQVRSQLDAFDHDAATQQLQNCLQEPRAVETVATVLSGSCRYVGVCIHRRGPFLYKPVYRQLLALVDGQAFSVSAEANESIQIQGVDPTRILANMQTHLQIQQERGAVP